MTAQASFSHMHNYRTVFCGDKWMLPFGRTSGPLGSLRNLLWRGARLALTKRRVEPQAAAEGVARATIRGLGAPPTGPVRDTGPPP